MDFKGSLGWMTPIECEMGVDNPHLSDDARLVLQSIERQIESHLAATPMTVGEITEYYETVKIPFESTPIVYNEIKNAIEDSITNDDEEIVIVTIMQASSLEARRIKAERDAQNHSANNNSD